MSIWLAQLVGVAGFSPPSDWRMLRLKLLEIRAPTDQDANYYSFMQLYRAQFFSMAYQLNRNLKGHPLASRMHVWFVHNKGIPYVWLPTTNNTMRMIVLNKYFIGTSLHRVNQPSQAHRTIIYSEVLLSWNFEQDDGCVAVGVRLGVVLVGR